MFTIGCHLSSSKGYMAMGQEAQSINANTFQFFTRNPRGGKMKPVNLEDIAALNKLLVENSFAPILAHAPYTLNPCALDENLRDFAREVFKSDLEILENIPGAMYNFHPGSHVKQGAEIGILKIAEVLNDVLFPEQKTIVLLDDIVIQGNNGIKIEAGQNVIIDLNGYSSTRSIKLATHISNESVAKLNEMSASFPGITTYSDTSIAYPYGELASHILGYTGAISEDELEADSSYNRNDVIGKTGIERTFEKYLRGKNGNLQEKNRATILL